MSDDPNTEMMARHARMEAAKLRPSIERGRTTIIVERRRKIIVTEKPQ